MTGRAVLTAIGPSGVRRYRIRLLGGAPTIKRTGRDGYACAHAMHDNTGSATAAAARCRKFRRGSFIAVSPLTPSFDHLVRELLDRQRHLKVKRLGGLQIDDKFEFG